MRNPTPRPPVRSRHDEPTVGRAEDSLASWRRSSSLFTIAAAICGVVASAGRARRVAPAASLAAVAALAVVAAVPALVACGGAPHESTPAAAEDGAAAPGRASLDAGERHAIYSRAESVVPVGELLGPRELDGTAADDPTFALAPLLVQDLGAAGEVLPVGRPGRLVDGPGSETRVEAGDPTVYHATSRVVLHGEMLEQRSYLWWYPAGEQRDSRLRGVRMTLGTDGFPFVWEVLGDSAGARPVFVSNALDARAAAEHGDPLGGRAFAVETPLETRPEVIVPGLLEPGPVPLGPFVYLTAAERDVSSLICRCMPSRVDRIAASSLYRLEPLDADLLDGLPESMRPDLADPALDSMLRLPTGPPAGS